MVNFVSAFLNGVSEVIQGITESLENSNKNSKINSMIEKILNTDPRVPDVAIITSGLTTRSPKDVKINDHAFHIGNNIWIGMRFAINREDHHLIMIGEFDSLYKDVTLVYDNGVEFPGTWQDKIESLLNQALAAAEIEAARVKESRHAMDTARANSI